MAPFWASLKQRTNNNIQSHEASILPAAYFLKFHSPTGQELWVLELFMRSWGHLWSLATTWYFAWAELLPKTKYFLTSIYSEKLQPLNKSLLYGKHRRPVFFYSGAISTPWCITNSLRGCPTMSTGWLSCRFAVLKLKLNCYHGNETQKKLSILENKNCLEFSFKDFTLNMRLFCIICIFIKIKIFPENMPKLSGCITHGPPIIM